MQSGSAAFLDGLERATGHTIPEEWLGNGVVYLVDSESMVDVETLWLRAQRVGRLHDERAIGDGGMRRYLRGQPPLERLTVPQAEVETGQRRAVGAWRTPERHISARAVADSVARALAERGTALTQGRVQRVLPRSEGWLVGLADGRSIAGNVVINCLWENRVVIDRQVRPSEEPTSIRYKRALFGRGVSSLANLAASTRVLGPYGDIAIYGNGDAYLSWYPAGLAARSDDGIPPSVPPFNSHTITDDTLAGLGLPRTLTTEAGASWELQGGFVVAWGRGDIDEVESPLHERHRPGVHQIGPGFLSVDTGKYTLGPLLAERAVEQTLMHLTSSGRRTNFR